MDQQSRTPTDLAPSIYCHQGCILVKFYSTTHRKSFTINYSVILDTRRLASRRPSTSPLTSIPPFLHTEEFQYGYEKASHRAHNHHSSQQATATIDIGFHPPRPTPQFQAFILTLPCPSRFPVSGFRTREQLSNGLAGTARGPLR